jgi:peptide-N4-(N-acetyl-beta-glucosaminyl)asparagine amidase
MVRVRMYEEKHVQEKILSIIPLTELEAEAKANCRKENLNNNLNQTSENQPKIELNSNQNENQNQNSEQTLTTKPLLSYRDELVRSLLKWFKYSFFTWCNQPLCNSCNQPASQYIETQTPTESEALWAASRTELYKCLPCNTINRFPRFNNPIKLCETKTGRCGEWANLFGAILRALNFEVRFVDNFEDHVWNEYFSEDLNSWIHVDPCENAWNTPLLYEQGWGRVMTFILAHSITGIQDVTARYIKDFALVSKRRNPNTEKKLKNVLRTQNEIVRKNFGSEEVKRLCYRDDYEVVMFGMEKFLSVEELLDRQSGSEEWRKSRGEMK